MLPSAFLDLYRQILDFHLRYIEENEDKDQQRNYSTQDQNFAEVRSPYLLSSYVQHFLLTRVHEITKFLLKGTLEVPN